MKTLKPLSFLILSVSLFLSCSKDAPVYTGNYTTQGNSSGSGNGGSSGTTSSGNTSTTGNTTTTGGGTQGIYYIKGSLNGNTLDWESNDDADDMWVVGFSSTGYIDKALRTKQLADGLSDGNNHYQPQFLIGLRTFQVNSEIMSTDDIKTYFLSFVTTGNWTYAIDDSDFTPQDKKTEIIYTDGNGVIYTTEGGSQTNSTFSISSATPVPPTLGRVDCVKIKVSFTCTLYPQSGTGAPLTFSNGQATILINDDLW